ncbi:MAG: tyrosine-type recombinase/integrase [bacterium]
MKQQLKDSEYHLKRQEIKKIINSALNFRDRCLLKTLAHTAMRRFEAANLDVRDIDFERKLIYIREGKGGKSRTIPVSEELLSDLRYLIGPKKNGALFANPRGERLSLRHINHILAKAGEKSGIQNPNPKYKNITCHLFRHSFAREWKRQGGSLETLSKILGHTSIKTTLDEYGTEDLEEVQENYEKLIGEMF